MIGKIIAGALLVSAVNSELRGVHDKRQRRLHQAGVRAGGLDGLAAVKDAQARTPYYVIGATICGAVIGWTLAAAAEVV